MNSTHYLDMSEGKHLKLYHQKIKLTMDEKDFTACISICYSLCIINCHKTVSFLHPEEEAYYNALSQARRQTSYLLGRYAAKQAIRELLQEPDLKKIPIIRGVFNQPVVRYPSNDRIEVSIAHSNNYGVAIAFNSAIPMGIDIEEIRHERSGILERKMTIEELSMIKQLSYPYDEMLIMLWTMKEAISKVLKTGLTLPFKVLEAVKIKECSSFITSTFKNFTQYQAVSFKAGRYYCSVVYPQDSKIQNLDINSLRTIFDYEPDS